MRIRLSLVDTPESDQDKYKEAKEFVKDLCLDKKGEVDIDDGQRRGDRYGRDIGIVYCDGTNLNAALMKNNLARIYTPLPSLSNITKFPLSIILLLLVWTNTLSTGNYLNLIK